MFTAGHEWFASKIIDFIDPTHELIQHRLYRQHTCQLGDSDDFFLVKDLSIFKGLNIDDVVIVDNNIYSFAFNLENGIPIHDFLGKKSDIELLKVMRYLDFLHKQPNLREANEKEHRLRQIFNSNIEEYIQYYDSDQWTEDDD